MQIALALHHPARTFGTQDFPFSNTHLTYLTPMNRFLSLATLIGFIVILSCLNSSLFAQCYTLPTGLTCDNATQMCGRYTSFCGKLPNANNTQPTRGTNLCPAEFENTSWITFVADSTEVIFKLRPYNCTGGITGSGNGMQFFAYETNDCTNFERIVCVNTIGRDFIDYFTLTNLTIGKAYYIMLDGQRGDICEFELEVTRGKLQGRSIVADRPVNGVGIVCSTTPETYSVTPVSGAISYQWRVPSDATIVGGNFTPSIQLRLGTVSDSVCVRAITLCDTTKYFCKKINVGQSKTLDITVFKCFGTNYRFNGQDLTSAGTYTANLLTSVGCDSTIRLTLRDYPPAIKALDTAICAGTTLRIGTTNITTSGTYQVILPNSSFYGCDSVVNADVKIIDFQTAVSKSNDISCANLTATLTANVVDIEPTGATVSVEWTNAAGQVVGRMASISVSQGGVYTATVKISFRGRTCQKVATVTVGQSGNIPQRPELRGPTTGCIGATAIFNIVSPQTGIDRYTWSANNATLSAGTTQITVTQWQASATNARVCVNAQNGCGTSDTTCLSVDLQTVPTPLSISGFTTLCPNGATTYSVPRTLGITDYQWVATNGTVIAGQNTPGVTVRWGTTNGTLTLTPRNVCGAGTPSSVNVTIKNQPPDAIPIRGNSNVCSNDTTTFSIPANSETTIYEWQVPTGAFVISGQNSNSIRVDWGSFTGAGTISLTTKNACDLSRTVSYPVNVRRATFTTPLITGLAVICPYSEATYTIAGDTSFINYQWTVPANAVITSGQGTRTITVNIQNATNGQVSVAVRNSCGTVRTSRLNVEVRSTLDSLLIDGRTNIVCRGDTASFFVPSDPNVQNYLWSAMATGSRILSGQGTNRITVLFGSTTGTIQVVPNGGCSDGIRSRLAITVKMPLNLTGEIAGNTQICANSTELYSVVQQNGAIGYSWNVPTGARIIGDSLGRTINVNFGTATTGTVSVRVLSECGYGESTLLPLTFIRNPVVNAGRDDTTCGTRIVLRGSSNGQTRQWTTLSAPLGGRATLATPTTAQTDVNVTVAGLYTFRYEEFNGNCGVADTVSIIFRPVPTLTLLDETCNREATEYRMRFSVSSGTAPYSLIGGTNTGAVFSQGAFLSNPVANNTPYSFVVSDAFGCKTDTLRGLRNCPCTTTAGSMQLDSLIVCFGSMGRATHQNNAQLDGNDTYEFLLHNGTRTTIGTSILARSRTGIFSFDSTAMQYNTVYYVAYAVGDSGTTGGVNRAHRCSAVTSGIPIVFKSQVQAGFMGDTTVCQNEPAKIIFKASQSGVFNILYRNSRAGSVANETITNNQTISVSSPTATTYTLIEAKDLFGCKATITDSMRVNHRPLPTANAGIDQSLCNTATPLDAAEDVSFLGTWSSLSGKVRFSNANNPRATATNLQNGKNFLIWTMRDTVCVNYVVRDTVLIFVPLSPEAPDYAFKAKQGDTIRGNVSLSAPIGTYSVTRLSNPTSGRFELFSSGSFTYIPDTNFLGIVKFRYMICSDQCSRLCDTGEVRILYERRDTVAKLALNIPNAITPNDDGKNDRWIIDGLEDYKENELVIFNRWGDVLYKVKSYQNDWEGNNLSGSPLPDGTYYYVLRLNVNDGKIFRGDITIIR
jgi:large repetitive protein